MSRAWMPLYVGDYLADTAHLTVAEHGAYLLLIMAYWQTGGLPADDENLRRVARMTKREWRIAKIKISPFFSADWRHKRIDQELERVKKLSDAGRTGGLASGRTRRQRSLNDRSTKSQRSLNESQSPKKEKIPESSDSAAIGPSGASRHDGREALERAYFRRGREILGKQAGGLLASLLKAKHQDIEAARATLELAATKHDPREFAAAACKPAPSARDDSRERLGHVLKTLADDSGPNGSARSETPDEKADRELPVSRTRRP